MSFFHNCTAPGSGGIEEEIGTEGDNSWGTTVNHIISKKGKVDPGISTGKSGSVTIGERNLAE